MNEPLSVLLIGKSPGNLEGMLRECGRTIRLLHCRHPEDGLDRVSEGGIDAVLLDLEDGQGIAIVDHLRRTAPGVPVIVLTATGEDPAVLHAAQDHLARERINAELLYRAIRCALERARAETALRHTGATYRKLVENLNEGVIAVDEAGLITFANPRMGEILGYPAERLVGRPVAGFFDAPDRVRSASKNLFCRETDRRQEFELDLRHSGGGRVHALMVTSPATDESGRFCGSIVGVLDITERKRAEEELRNRNEQLMILNQIISVSATSLSLAELLEESLEKVLELMGFHVGIVYMLDADRRLARAQHQRGVPSSYISKGRTIKIHHWPFNFIFVAGQPRYIEHRPDLNSIEAGILRELDVSALACIPLIAESVVVGAVYTGSRSKKSFSREEQTLLEMIGKEIGSGILKGMLHKRLEAANREANLYLDIMTHDIRNTENVSGLYAGLLIEMLEGEAALYAQKIEESILRSKEILRNVTTIRRIHHEAPDARPIDLDAVIRGEIADFPDTAIELWGAPRRVWADDLLPEVFSNLIRNAVKLGGPGTAITVRVEEYGDENILISIEDTGPGIPDPLKGSILHRFERGWIEGCGDGLGLFVVWTLIERYGGTLRVEDRVEGRPDLGAAFRFTLREVLPSGSDGGGGRYPVEEECE
ncbi:MAG: PAS domain S-box protein [Methanomicrobiales archaeon]|jgi:PAS domain S-box-containing protein|nr:PAS domain S-box protein [Methanomicrobiales archaeon]